MSQIFPKNKEKRPHPPDEASTSFVKNVTSRVSGLLPATITKWFSSPSSSNANGSSSVADASDSSDDETSETTVITPPPAKRKRYSLPGTYSHYGPSEAGCSSSDVEIMELPYSPFSGPQYAQTSRSTFASPMRPQNDEPQPMDKDSPHIFKMPHSVSSVGQSISQKRKSIFETTAQEDPAREVAKTASNTMRDPTKTSFKASLLGSPFYAGRTMYGGAAASSYINQPNIKQETVAVVNESKSNDDNVSSNSSRRVMDLLEGYSSPVKEARRIPLYTKPKNDGFNNTSSDSSCPYRNNTLSYKTQELHVPNIASILRLKKKSRLMNTTSAARQIMASHSSASHFPTYPTAAKGKEPEMEQPHKMTTKVKSRLTRTNRGISDDYEVATPVKLPTGVLQLDQDKLPHFSFGTPSVSKLPATSTPRIVFPTADKKITASKHETVINSVFKFSNPVEVSNDSLEAFTTPPKFTFDSPERCIDRKFESKRDDCSVFVGKAKEPETSPARSKGWTCADCWVKNNLEDKKCVCCGSKQPLQDTKCSVCKLADTQSQKEKCANCEMSVPQVASLLTAKSTGISLSSKWICEDCWVSNEDCVVKCACCGGSRPRKVNSDTVTVAATSVTNTTTVHTSTVIFKPVAVKAVPATEKVDAGWKCEDCWISNKSSVDKCAACGGARSGAKQTNAADASLNSNSFFGSSDDKFKNIIQTQKSQTWECSSCLVRNESEKDKCVCCGTEKEKKKKIPESKFNFGSTTHSSFKFGIDPKVQEATKIPEIISTLDPKFKTQSETNNNVLVETPTFTFALPSKKLENTIDLSTEKSDDAPKLNFTFGIPKIIPPSTVVTESNEKLQEVPSVDLNAPVQSKPIVVPARTQIITQNNTLISETPLNTNHASDAKKDTPVNSPNLPKTSSAEQPKPTFSFGVSPNTKSFVTTASSSTSVNLFTHQSQASTLPKTSAPSLSLFKPPESSTSTTSLFQPPDLTVITAPLFQSNESTTNKNTPAPMFSFGNSAAINLAPLAALTLPAATEKPNFAFTFGNNPTPNTDPPALFKAPFGAAENSNSATSNPPNTSFNLSVGTTLGSNNNLPSSSSLGGSTALAGANGLTGNAMAGTLLGSIPGNSLSTNTVTIGNGGALGSTNGLSVNSLSGLSSMQSGNAFIMQKDVMWSAGSTSQSPNLFVCNALTSSLQKPPSFTFGSSTPFNVTGSTPTFGTTAAPPQNMFGMNNQSNNTQPSMFSNTAQTQPTGNLFSSSQPSSNTTTTMPMPFGTPSIGSSPTFYTPNSTMTSFETSSLNSAPAAFNFGAPQATGIFGFGQQQQHQQQQMQQQHLQQQQQQLHQSTPQQTGVYSFGGAPAGGPPVQFSMGSGANPAVRRVRKAVRRNPQR